MLRKQCFLPWGCGEMIESKYSLRCKFITHGYMLFTLLGFVMMFVAFNFIYAIWCFLGGAVSLLFAFFAMAFEESGVFLIISRVWFISFSLIIISGYVFTIITKRFSLFWFVMCLDIVAICALEIIGYRVGGGANPIIVLLALVIKVLSAIFFLHAIVKKNQEYQ